MKAFTHTFLLLLSFGFLCSAVSAQQFTVSGTLLFGENQDPTPGLILIYDGDEAVSEEEVYYTDSIGNYSAILSPETDGLPYIVKVETFDFCTGESIIQQVEFTADPQTIEGIDFVICTDFNPPPPPEGCDAYFTYETPEDDPLTVTFIDLSYSDLDEITYEWDFGDGNTSTEQNPTHTYDQAGVYDVTLMITTDDGCTSTTIQHICIGFEDCDCEDEVFNPVCVEIDSGFILTFNNPCLAECAGFGEDTWVECEDDCFCEDIFNPVCVPLDGDTILVFINACLAECEGYTEDQFGQCDGFEDCQSNFFMTPTDNELTVLFEDVSFANIGNVVGWEWDFGDGNTSTEQHPTHTYAEEGIFEVTLDIITDEGCTSSLTRHICLGEGGYYEGPDCQAIFYFTQHDDDLSTFDFIDLSFGDNIDSYFWDFGDGNTSTAQNPTHTYTEEGVYTVTLTTSGGEGDEACESWISVVLFTNPNAWYETECNALFVPFIIPETNEVFFLSLSSADAVSFVWDFGDGVTSEDPLASHQYAESGTYEVSLTITTADGCESTYYVTIDIENEQFTGSQQFSLSSSTEDQLAINNKLTAQPNPTSGEVFIQFTAQNNDLHEINIISVEGQTLRTIQTRAQEGENQVNTNIDDLPAGLYLIQLQNKQEIQTTRIIKK